MDKLEATVGLKMMNGLWWPDRLEQKTADFHQTNLESLKRFLPLVQRRRGVVQAGGSYGLWPKALAAEFETVWTFEPEPDSFRCLCLNVPEKNVHKFNTALAERPGVCVLKAKGDSAHRAVSFKQGSTPMLSLELMDYVYDALILDVEGFEVNVLKGASKSVMNHRPVIMIEDIEEIRAFYGIKKADVLAVFEAFRYTLVGGHRHDLFWMPQERASSDMLASGKRVKW